MVTYITLLRYTEQGIANIKGGPERLIRARELIRTMGGDLKQWYLVNGQYDAVSIIDAPDDETATRISLAIARQGNVRTETLRAYSDQEFKDIIAGLP